jgi:hypothetical protein
MLIDNMSVPIQWTIFRFQTMLRFDNKISKNYISTLANLNEGTLRVDVVILESRCLSFEFKL